MSDPVMFVSHFRIKEGAHDGFMRLTTDVTERLASEKPRTLVFLVYLDERRERATFVHVFGDAESMDLHFQGSEERGRAAFEFVEPEGWEFYGRLSDAALETMRQTATAAGVPLTVEPNYVAGFLRLGSGG
jgi:hypothetical protein